MKIRVMLADDHRMLREALRLSLSAEPDIEVVAEADSGASALRGLAEARPEVLVLDIALPDINGIDVARQALHRFPTTRIVALSGYADRTFVEEMLKTGAQAFVVKSSGADELARAIRAVHAGHTFLSPEVTASALKRAGTAPLPTSALGSREREVLHLLAEGSSSAEIAKKLSISKATVSVHRRNIKHKLGITTTAELTRYAISEDI